MENSTVTALLDVWTRGCRAVEELSHRKVKEEKKRTRTQSAMSGEVSSRGGPWPVTRVDALICWQAQLLPQLKSSQREPQLRANWPSSPVWAAWLRSMDLAVTWGKSVQEASSFPACALKLQPCKVYSALGHVCTQMLWLACCFTHKHKCRHQSTQKNTERETRALFLSLIFEQSVPDQQFQRPWTCSPPDKSVCCNHSVI